MAKITKHTDGTTIRDYIGYVEDLAKIHMSTANLLPKKKIFQTFNCGYGYGYSVKQILEKFTFYSKNRIKFKAGERRPKDIVTSIANSNKLKKFIRLQFKYNNLITCGKIFLEVVQKNVKLLIILMIKFTKKKKNYFIYNFHFS